MSTSFYITERIRNAAYASLSWPGGGTGGKVCNLYWNCCARIWVHKRFGPQPTRTACWTGTWSRDAAGACDAIRHINLSSISLRIHGQCRRPFVRFLIENYHQMLYKTASRYRIVTTYGSRYVTNVILDTLTANNFTIPVRYEPLIRMCPAPKSRRIKSSEYRPALLILIVYKESAKLSRINTTIAKLQASEPKWAQSVQVTNMATHLARIESFAASNRIESNCRWSYAK